MIADYVLDWRLQAAAAVGAFALAAVLGRWYARRGVLALRAELREKGERLEATERAHRLSVERGKDLEQKLSISDECLIMTEAKVAKLEDRVKMLVAKHQEHDLWAAPLRGALGDAVSQKVRELTARVQQQAQAIAQRDRLHGLMKAKLAELEQARLHAVKELVDKERVLTELAHRVSQLEQTSISTSPAAAQPMLELDAIAVDPAAAHAEDAAIDAPDVHPPDTARWGRAMGGTSKEEQLQVLLDWQQRLERRLSDLENLQVRLHRVYSRVPDKESPQDDRNALAG